MVRSSARAAVLVGTCALLGALLVPTSVHAAVAPSWMRRMSGTVSDVAHDARGRIYVVGTRIETHSLFVRSYSAAGGLRWTRRWRPAPGGGIVEPGAQGLSIDVAPDGAIYVGGQVHAPSECGEGGAWLVARLGPRGRMVWHRVGAAWRDCLGTSGAVWAIAATDDMVVAAVTEEGCCDDPSSEGSLVGLSPAGRRLWRNPFELPRVPHDRYDRVFDVTVGALGRSYAVGWAERGPSDDVGVVMKVAPDGSTIWHRTFGGGGRYGSASSVTARGPWLVVGAWVARPTVLRLTFGGHLLRTWSWSSRFGGSPDVSLTRGGALYVVMGVGLDVVRIRKLFVTGGMAWSTTLSPSGRYIEAGGEASGGGITLAGNEEDARRPGRVWRIDR